MDDQRKSIFAPSKLWRIILLVVILACGLTTRLYDLTDPPLDYAPSRQLRSAIIARSIYYENTDNISESERDVARRQAVSQEMLEPRIIENITAFLYQVTGTENVWYARLFSSMFWTIGGLFLFLLIRDQISFDAGVIALIYYLYVPFGLLASRTFQPDPLMTCLVIGSWWAYLRWINLRDWQSAWIAGLIAGLAILVKLPAVFFLFFGMAYLAITEFQIRKLIKDKQVWLIGIVAVIPAVFYQFYGFFISGRLSGQLSGRLFNPDLWGSPDFYLNWLGTSSKVTGHLVILLISLVAVAAVQNKTFRNFLIATWIGYLVYGFAFSYYVTTHAYYLLPVIPLTAVTIGVGGNWVLSRMARWLSYPLALGGVAVLLTIGAAGGYFIFHREDYRHEPAYYHQVANYVSSEGSIIALSQDYGYRLAYYGGIVVQPWTKLENLAPENIDLDSASYDEVFAEVMKNFDYFVITRMKDYRKQTDLKNELTENYPVLVEGGGYIIFSLQERGD
jgi:hypothetical protein